ncbi:MAG: hypothetical protein HC827_00815 [Cyanobacteria bacterium RM1_2_2]|nr:hypothetical protein [Cyanobacteria bacterium RM1_2_2]
MKKIYLALLLSFLGVVSLNPVLAETSQNGNQSAPEAETQVTPVQPQDSQEPSEAEGADVNAPPLGGTVPDTTTPTGETVVVEDYKQYPEYSELQAALQQQPPNWQLADQKTYELMLRIAGANSQSQGAFAVDDWQQFPCNALQDIDQLWMQASSGQQGFSRQWDIFQSARPNQELYYYRIGWKELSGAWKVAWRIRDNNLEYIQNASPNFTDPPAGHLPAGLEWQDGKDYRFQAVDRCGLNQ